MEKKETYLTIREAAEILRVHEEVLRRKVRAGKIKAVRPLDLKILIPESELNKVLNF